MVHPKLILTRRKMGRLLILLVIVLMLILPLRVGVAGYQTYRTLDQLAREVRQVQEPAALSNLQPHVQQLRANLAHLQQTLFPLMPLLRQLTFLPRYGPLLAQVDDLVAVGEQGIAIAEEAIELIHTSALEPTLRGSAAWVAVGPVVAPLADELQALEDRVAVLPIEQSSGQARNLLANLYGASQLATLAVQLGEEWPKLLGVVRPATYLVLVQNNHELRATGGFISALAPIIFVNGQMQPVEFVDSYEIFSYDLAYPPSPPAMRTYMGIELLTLRDANWSPHLPSAATLIRTLYQQHSGLAVDGVVTVDMDAVRWLLPAFGHLTLPDSTFAITQENVEQALVQLWNTPFDASASSRASTSATASTSNTAGQGNWWEQRKDFIGQLTSAAFSRLRQNSFNPLALVGGVAEGLDRRAIQAWLFDPAAQLPLIERGWDGGLHPELGADFLSVVDSNLGYNKANAIVTRAVDYQLDWPDDSSMGAEVTLTLTYTHPIDRTDPVCKAVSYYGARYEDMIARCYFNYSRVYVPGGSELLSVEGWLGSTVSSERAEQGTQQFAGYFVLNPGTSHVVILHYRLPANLRPEEYQLIVQRQSGTDPLPVYLHSADAEWRTTLNVGRLEWQPSP